ncbi:MAG: D-glycero-beta-D-manno-heptose 1,7-bisphosphate 7-phosphatase [Proteobacteria bacterium]|nr:D-glycero-beta-D-manno-heptose 1,7-bisphosphate 7-phosphatase [Pseudomonadota bacterium]HQR04674.1 D-glycero-beta-D-manno-heptose 1,7-bisphosphate 7-phosphatase [Rhodocyclaceae bacterium]
MHVSLRSRRATHPVPAVFLDRDGTINVEKEYLHRIEDWDWIPGSPEAIAALNRSGFFVIVVSNQAGIAREFYSIGDVELLHEYVSQELQRHGGRIDAFCFCPHHPDHGQKGSCTCRKPGPGMILNSARMLNIDLARSWMVGDKLIDVEAGKAAGVTSILVQTGYGRTEMPGAAMGQLTVANLPEAAAMIIAAVQGGASVAQ